MNVVVLDTFFFKAAIAVGILPPPAGYIQWLKGGTSNGLPTVDRVGTLSAPVEDAGTLIQTDVKILSSMVSISSFGPASNLVFNNNTMYNGKPKLVHSGFPGDFVQWDGAKWFASMSGGGIQDWEHPTDTGTFPPKTGWVSLNASVETLSFSYDSFWIENGEFIARTQAEIENHNENEFATRASVNGSNVVSILTYPEAPTGADLLQLNQFLFQECSDDIGFYNDYSMMIDTNGELQKYEV